MTTGERFGLAAMAVFAALVVALFVGSPSARQERAVAEGQRTLAEIELRAANNRYACHHGVADACN